MAALRAYPRLRPESNVRAWLLTIAHRKAIDAHRARARRPLPGRGGAAAEAAGGPACRRRDRRRSCGSACARCRPSSAARSCCAMQATCPTRRSPAPSTAPRRRRGAACTKGPGDKGRRKEEPLEEGSPGPRPPTGGAGRANGARAGRGGRLRERAESPLGDLRSWRRRDRGLVRVAYADGGADPVLDDIARRLSPRMLESPARLDRARRELDEYFAGGRRAFELPIDWRLMPGFGHAVLRATARIPYGGGRDVQVHRRPGRQPARAARPATRSAPTRCPS